MTEDWIGADGLTTLEVPKFQRKTTPWVNCRPAVMARFHVTRVLKLLIIFTCALGLGYFFAGIKPGIYQGTERDIKAVQGELPVRVLEQVAQDEPIRALEPPGLLQPPNEDEPGHNAQLAQHPEADVKADPDKDEPVGQGHDQAPDEDEPGHNAHLAQYPEADEKADPDEDEPVGRGHDKAPDEEPQPPDQLPPIKAPAGNVAPPGGNKGNESQPFHSRFQKVPFDEGQPKQLVILAYQRVGSSFFGEIFDLNPDIFYVYEPLDGLYQSIYGTSSGMSVPSDITAFSNGSDRLLPRHEVQAVSQFIDDLLECRVPQLPSEFVLHHFWSFLAVFMPSWKPYLHCLTKAKAIKSLEGCANSTTLRRRCPARFGDRLGMSESCRVQLSLEPDKMQTPFTDYKKCVSDKRQQSSKCLDLMQTKCSDTSFRATKTVRGTMEAIGELLKKPNFRIIHLIRDPRPVVASRLVAPTFHGLYSKGKPRNARTKEAQIYCNTLRRDLYKRQELEKKYPGRIIQVVYEDFVKYPVEYAKSVYDFLGYDIPQKLVPWIANHTNAAKAGGKHNTPPRWKRVMSDKEILDVEKACLDIPKLVGFQWRDWKTAR